MMIATFVRSIPPTPTGWKGDARLYSVTEDDMPVGFAVASAVDTGDIQETGVTWADADGKPIDPLFLYLNIALGRVEGLDHVAALASAGMTLAPTPEPVT